MTRLLIQCLAIAALCAGAAPAHAICSRLPYARTKPLVDSFMIRPEGMLDQYPRGDPALVGAIRDLVSSDPDTTLAPVLDLIKSANRYQKQDIGTGLGNAARLCDQAAESWKGRQLLQAARVNSDRTLLEAFMLAYKGAAPPLPTPPADVDRTTNPLGKGYISSPDINAFKKQRLPDPFAPIR